MLTLEDTDKFHKALEECEKRLMEMRGRAPKKLQPKINIAFASLTAIRMRLQENRDFEEMLYLFGRVHWTLGFVSASKPEETTTGTLTDILKDDNAPMPTLDALLKED